jgi:cell division protein FtsI/penicillin-binding protein 2
VQSIGGQKLTPTQSHNRVISESVDKFVTEAMREVVRRGSGTRAAVKGTTVYGKTGTADNPGGRPHAWFIGYAAHKKGKVAVAAVVENAGLGGYQAAPIASRVIQAAIESANSAKSAGSR